MWSGLFPCHLFCRRSIWHTVLAAICEATLSLQKDIFNLPFNKHQFPTWFYNLFIRRCYEVFVSSVLLCSLCSETFKTDCASFCNMKEKRKKDVRFICYVKHKSLQSIWFMTNTLVFFKALWILLCYISMILDILSVNTLELWKDFNLVHADYISSALHYIITNSFASNRQGLPSSQKHSHF